MKIRYDPAKEEYVEKYILREAGKAYITEEVYKKKKHPYSAPVSFPIDGPLHRLMRELVTKENVGMLGWLDGEGVEGEVEKAFVGKDKESFRLVLCLAQWVVIGKRFGIKRAEVKGDGKGVGEREGGSVMLG